MSIICGIDPGLSGGVAAISLPTKEYETWATPLIAKGEIDMRYIAKRFRYWKHQGLYIYIEKVHAMPGQGVSSMFKFGKVYGEVLGAIKSENIPHTLITPQKWQKEIFQGIETKLKPKEKALIAAKRLFPNESFLATPRSRKPHDGMVDALLLAEYGRRQT